MVKQITFILCISLSATAMAADIVELPASQGKVAFPHKKHQDMLKDCMKCHEKGPGKIADLGKAWAHTVCKGCHMDMKKGPVACSECHNGIN